MEVQKLSENVVLMLADEKGGVKYLHRVIALLQEPGVPEANEKIFNEIRRCDDYEKVAKVLRMVFMQKPKESDKFFELLQELFVQNDPLPDRVATSNPFLVQGVVLGMFEVLGMINEHPAWAWTKQCLIATTWPAIVADMITSQNSLMRSCDDFKNDKEYHGKLSQAIKFALRGRHAVRSTTQKVEDGKNQIDGMRLAQVSSIVRAICQRRGLMWQKKNDELTALGSKIIDELCYAVFGMISSDAKVDLINHLFDSLLCQFTKLAEKEA